MNAQPLKRVARLFAPRSLRYQLLSRSFLILAALLLLIGIFQYFIMEQFLYKNRAETIQSQIQKLPIEVLLSGFGIPIDPRGRPGGRDNGRHPDSQQGPFEQSLLVGSTLAFYSSDGEFNVLIENEELGPAPQLTDEDYQEVMGQKPDAPAFYKLVNDAKGNEQLVVLAPYRMHGDRVSGVVELGTLSQPLRQVMLRQLLIFAGLSAIALLFGLLTFLPVLKRTLVPLSNIVDTVEKIDAGSLDERLPMEQGQSEIDRLSHTVNRMLERLETSFEAEKEAREQMRRFIADASHELRTPLTSIHGFLEVLLRGAATQPEQLHRALNSMHSESERLNKLVNDLLQLAKLDRSPTVLFQPGQLDDVLKEMEPQLRILAGSRRVTFESENGLAATFDKDKIKQVILNLFHNAVQHTDPETGEIKLSLEKSGERIELTVADNGHGIQEDHLPHLFERFYRADSSRSRKLGGSGLGLSITKSIVEHHRGTIEVESRVGEGSTFRIFLPLDA